MTPGQHETSDTSAVITRVLEAAPVITVRQDFAADVCAALPAKTNPAFVGMGRSWLGVRLSVVVLAALLVAGFGFAALAVSGSSFWQVASDAALIELVVLLSLLSLLKRYSVLAIWGHWRS